MIGNTPFIPYHSSMMRICSGRLESFRKRFHVTGITYIPVIKPIPVVFTMIFTYIYTHLHCCWLERNGSTGTRRVTVVQAVDILKLSLPGVGHFRDNFICRTMYVRTLDENSVFKSNHPSTIEILKCLYIPIALC